MVIAVVFTFSCGGQAPAPASEPPPSPVEQAPEPLEPPAPTAVEPPPPPPPEPPTEPPPVETPEPAPPRPTPPPEPICAELEQGLCQVTEGCEWHSIRKCLEQEKPKTLAK